MSKVDLLAPRVKLIADYPLSSLYMKVGDILTLGRFGYESSKGVSMAPETVEQYPHLFQPLPWYAERNISDMPMFVKVNSETTALFIGDIFKVSIWKARASGQFYCWLEEDKAKSFPDIFMYEPDHFLPATEQEYTNYLKSKQP